MRDSFFLWFEEGVPRGDATLADDPVADIIKEQIWPNPLPLYLAGHYVRACSCHTFNLSAQGRDLGIHQDLHTRSYACMYR